MLLVSVDQKAFVQTWSRYTKVDEWEKNDHDLIPHGTCSPEKQILIKLSAVFGLRVYNTWIGPGLGINKGILEEMSFELRYEKWERTSQTRSNSCLEFWVYMQWPKWGKHRSAFKKCRKNRCGCSSDEELKRGQPQLSEKQSLVSAALGNVQQLVWGRREEAPRAAFAHFPV